MKNLLGNIPLLLRILKTKTELVLGKEVVFGEIPTSPTRILERQGSADIVKEGPAACYRAMGVKGLKCLIAHGTRRITHNKGTEGRSRLKRDRMNMCRKVERETNGVVLTVTREHCCT